MKDFNEIIKLLDLDKNEQKILHILSDKVQLASSLQKNINIPRATLDRTLLKLHKRGVVAKKKYSKKRVGWVKKLDLISHTIELEQNNTKMIELFLDRESMLYAVHDFIKTTKNSRAFAIQNNRAWRMWTEVLSEDIVNNLHDTFAKNKIILDMVISDEFEFELLKNSYSERPSSINIVPEKYLQTDLDIEMNGKYLLIMNWRKQKGIKINDPDIVRFFTGILKYIKDTAPMLNIHK